MVASGALLLATDALSIERTHGSYILSACDFAKATLTELSYLQGSAELLIKFAETYDSESVTRSRETYDSESGTRSRETYDSESVTRSRETYDSESGTVLNEHMFNETMQRNIAQLRAMLLDDDFAEICPNMTGVQQHDRRPEDGVST